jgi:hypothetical protein
MAIVLRCSAWVQSTGLRLLHFCLATDALLDKAMSSVEHWLGGCLDSMVVFCTFLAKRVVLQPWPPPKQFERQCNEDQLRPIPWSSFISNTVQMDGFDRTQAVGLIQASLGKRWLVADLMNWLYCKCKAECTVAGLLFPLHLITTRRIRMLVVNRNVLLLLGCMSNMMIQFMQLHQDVILGILWLDSSASGMDYKCKDCNWFMVIWLLPAWTQFVVSSFKVDFILSLCSTPTSTYNTFQASGKTTILSQTKFLQFPWDPGRTGRHRLEGKPNFKKGGMSGEGAGCTARQGPAVRQRLRQGQAGTKEPGWQERRIIKLSEEEYPFLIYCSSSSPSLLLYPGSNL